MNLTEIKIYRMTHMDNISHILQYGITHRESPSRNPGFISIGDVSLIHTRDHKQVRVDNGDMDNLNAPRITLGNFIPFYFGVKMPMLYVIQHGGNFVLTPTPPAKIVYLVCSVSQVIQHHNTYYFSDGHATDNLTTFYDASCIKQLPGIIDWAAVKEPYWSGQENLNVKRKKQAEFLIADDIAPHLVTGFGCYNEAAKNELTTLGIAAEKIKVIPQAYY